MPNTTENNAQTLVDLETRFWQAMVDQDADAAVGMLNDTAIMVSSHGRIQFDHAGYRKMASHGPMVVTSFSFDDMQVMQADANTAVVTYRVTQQVAERGKKETLTQEMNDTSTWIRVGDAWKCVMHTETPAANKSGKR
ncbi:MAG: nuclear transport factor 2 family protein [Polaromonas sp.]|nr:nuclear transport factor 2 family protein [Polaromonas sp.]